MERLLVLVVKDTEYEIGGGALGDIAVSYTHLRAHETVLDLVCRLLLEKNKQQPDQDTLDEDKLERDDNGVQRYGGWKT